MLGSGGFVYESNAVGFARFVEGNFASHCIGQDVEVAGFQGRSEINGRRIESGLDRASPMASRRVETLVPQLHVFREQTLGLLVSGMKFLGHPLGVLPLGQNRAMNRHNGYAEFFGPFTGQQFPGPELGRRQQYPG